MHRRLGRGRVRQTRQLSVVTWQLPAAIERERCRAHHMWPQPLTVTLVAAGAAALGSLLAIFLTPWLQRHFWRTQRRDELRLEAIYELKRLAAEFQLGHTKCWDWKGGRTCMILYKGTRCGGMRPLWRSCTDRVTTHGLL